MTVDVVLELDAHLPLGRLVANERVLEQLLRRRTLCVVLQVTRVDETMKALRPAQRAYSATLTTLHT